MSGSIFLGAIAGSSHHRLDLATHEPQYGRFHADTVSASNSHDPFNLAFGQGDRHFSGLPFMDRHQPDGFAIPKVFDRHANRLRKPQEHARTRERSPIFIPAHLRVVHACRSAKLALS